jgi:hypothetical protein
MNPEAMDGWEKPRLVTSKRPGEKQAGQTRK